MSLQQLFDLGRLGINEDVRVNLDRAGAPDNLHFSELVTEAVRRSEGSLSGHGTLLINTRVDDRYGEKRHTGRTPAARYIVDDAPGVDFSNTKLNQPMGRQQAERIYREAVRYINEKKDIFVVLISS